MLHVGCTTAQVQRLDDDSCFCYLFFFLCSRSSLVDFLSSVVVDFSCFIAAKQLFETKLEMPPVRSLLYFFTTHPSIDIQLSPRIAALICPFCRVYLFDTSSVSNVHPYISRYLALSFPFFFFYHPGYAYTVTRTLLPPIFDIPVGFLRPAQSPS